MRRAEGSFSSRSGAAWERRRADRNRARDYALVASPNASPAEAVIAPSREAMRDAIAAQLCPFCGAGPYKNLAMHTVRTHGWSAAELREASGLRRVCSEDLSRGSHERLIARPDFEEITARGHQESMARESYKIATARTIEARAEVAAQRNPEIVRLARQGVPRWQIAEQVGVVPETVRRVLVTEGVPVPMEETNKERRERLAAHRAAARETRDRAQQEQREYRLRRFAELGGDWSAMHALAEECGTSAKSMTAYLRKLGVNLPDGRRT